DGVILSADPQIGQMHRGAEKLFESRDYRQVLLLADRHDWLSPVGSEIGAALCMEHMLGIDVSRRAQLLRMLVAELSRIAAHAMFISEFPMRTIDESVASSPAWMNAVRDWRTLRDDILECVAALTGARVHVMWNVIGGVLNDADTQWCDRARDLMSIDSLCDATAAVFDAPVVLQRLDGLTVINREMVSDHAITGITARAAGVQRDARRNPGYLLYDEFADHLPTFSQSTGSAQARINLLINEALASSGMVCVLSYALADSPGEINIQLPKTVRMPEGSVYRETENALGINGFWLVSAGDKMPHRLKIRAASFSTLSAIPVVLAGLSTADVIPTLATIPYLAGDSDR
ncbi:MAG: NADH-quinone oxidoreductase subunit D, partial [Actinobacteria bacterium]|nr:NADH-quinone oxidoreductase subunit D [Actinomycetota bacterium]